jgi:multidrug efflux pump subunit AcrB
MDFFASDPFRVFYVNIENPTTASLEDTMQKVLQAEKQAEKHFKDGEIRSVVSYSGQMFTETAPYYGDHLGQVFVSLNPKMNGMRSVSEIIESMREDVTSISGPENISFLKLSGGPPASRAINLKVRGDNYEEIRSATDILLKFLNNDSDYTDISDDDSKGRFGLNLRLNHDAVNRTGIHPDTVYRTISMLVDGELVNEVREAGELVKVRVKSSVAVANNSSDIRELLAMSLPARDGTPIPLNQLVNIKTEKVKGNLRHYNFRRTITIESDINKENTDTVKANAKIVKYWNTISGNYPNINLDFTGELDDIQESMGALGLLLLLGVGLIYLILSTQFQSYFQPIMILVTVPMAFIGVILGLIVSGNPLSLFTMYGIVALVGISVNASIVLISTANSNLEKGMSLIHATFFAAKRRVLPITITVLTTMGGLFSLAVGLGGSSLIFGPVATAIVWGLAFSSVLTMFIIPVLYQASMKKAAEKIRVKNNLPSV